MLRFFGRDGTEWTQDEWSAVYGPPLIAMPEGALYRLTELHDSGEPAGMDSQIVVKGGGLPEGLKVILSWPDGSSVAGQKTPDTWEVVLGSTCYAPPDRGAYNVYIDAPDGMSEILGGFGWLCKTVHRHPQKIVFLRGKGDEPPPTEPPVPIPPPIPIPPEPPVPTEELWARVFATLDELRAALVALRDST